MLRWPSAGDEPARAKLIGAGALGVVAVGLAAAVLSRRRTARASGGPATLLRGSSALLAGSVLTDSAIEHYRGAFMNPGMWAPLAVSSAVIGSELAGGGGTGIGAVAVLTGATGLGFHVYNVSKRLGGFSWSNLFYAAPLGAPGALLLAGLLAGAADVVAGGATELLPVPAGPGLALLVCAGLAGTLTEVWLLHFRGAFHDPFMFVPILIPPVAIATLIAAAANPTPAAQSRAEKWLLRTAIMGVIGVGFHLFGLSRRMGGFHNLSQNLLEGPPVPAPPSFTGLALAGLAALDLLEPSGG